MLHLLIGTYSKRKWAKDPNNTAWSRNTDTFGQKILRSQGWAPGQYLGAQDASHSEFYSAANASHIRAVLKDDNLGLGAKRNQGDECTGLDALQELLGRLNGKSQESLDEDKKKREDVRINKYLHRKLGTIRFVYGGLLVGDKVQELADNLKKEREAAAAAATIPSQANDEKKAKSKKRKAEDDSDVIPEKKKSKKSKKQASVEAEEDSKAKRKEKKEKKKRKEASRNDTVLELNEEEFKSDDTEDATSRKKSKKDKKEKRKKSKESEMADADENSDSQSKKKRKAEKDVEAKTSKVVLAETASSKSTSGISTPIEVTPHRHLARKRFIAQKRAAVMDQAALNQVRLQTLARLFLSVHITYPYLADLHDQGINKGLPGGPDRDCSALRINIPPDDRPANIRLFTIVGQSVGA